MSIINPPLTESMTLNATLLELIRELNSLEQSQLKLLEDIRKATNFADLQVRIDKR